MNRVLWFHPRPLLPPQGGGDLRTLGLVSEVVAAGHEVLVVTANEPRESAPGFEIFPVRTRGGVGRTWAKIVSPHPLRSPRPIVSDMECARERIAGFDPHVAVVSEVMTESIARPLLPDVPWIYDAHNVEHVLFDRMAGEARGVVDRATLAVDRRRVARAERSLVAGASAIIAVSEEDLLGLAELGPRRPPMVVGSSVPLPPDPAQPGSAAPVALFLGTLDYLPNVAAVTELVEEVMPAVRRTIPEARLSVVGRRATQELRALLKSVEWVDFHDNVVDVAPHYREARCVVLPIRFGGGSRLKVSEGLAWGLPLVGTDAAFSGLPVPDSVALRGDIPDELAGHVVRVMGDAKLAERLGRSARSHFEEKLALPVVTRPLLRLIEQLT